MTDMGTLYFCSSVSRLSILVIFIAMAFSQATKPYMFYWIVALISSGLGSIISMNFSNSSTFPIFSAIAVYTLFFCSLTSSWCGLRNFYDRTISIPLFLSLTIIPSIIYSIAVIVNFSDRVTLSMVYFMASAITLLVIYEIYKAPDKKIISQYIVAFAFFTYFLALLVPGFLIALAVMPAKQNVSAHSALLFDQAASILVYFGYIAMAGEQANSAIQKLADTDPLTKLINRRGAHKLLKSLYFKSSLGGKASLLIGDIDFFKTINDTLGHQAGDIVLIGVSEVIRNNFRKYDQAIRWGGEEFLIVLPDTDADEAKILAERLRQAIEKFIFLDGCKEIKVTISMGLTEIHPSDDSYEKAIARADEGLYLAKKNGRNCIRETVYKKSIDVHS